MRVDRTASPRPRMPLGFRLWFAFIGALMLATFVGMGVMAHRVSTDPEGTGRFIGRVVGGAISGALEGR